MEAIYETLAQSWIGAALALTAGLTVAVVGYRMIFAVNIDGEPRPRADQLAPVVFGAGVLVAILGFVALLMPGNLHS